jgi:hypothetical protein
VVLLYLLWAAEGVDMPMLGNYSISEKWKNIDISSQIFAKMVATKSIFCPYYV